MDQPGLDPAEHGRALDALARVNLLSLTASTLAATLARFQHDAGLSTLRVLDVACGGGDIVRALARPGWSVAGCDISPTAVAHAASRGGEFFVHDALGAALPAGYDAVVCSLFLHHLGEEQVVALLRRFAASGARFVAVSDLDRCRAGLWSAYLITRLITRSPVVHYDGPVSVRAAFTPAEARCLAVRAGLRGARVERSWPFRWLLTWRAAAAAGTSAADSGTSPDSAGPASPR
ncbi:MAG: methyltransferase domain-containing protein [Gemmataceae bacterium]